MDRMLQIDCGDIHAWQCHCPASLAINKGDDCIVQKNNILEYGRVLMESQNVGEDVEPLPVVLRRATLQDQASAKENVLLSKSAFRICQEKVTRHKLQMRLVRVHYSFNRVQLEVVFTAEERCDYRALVHDLAGELQVRVEMRQIGVRDLAALRGGLASCGRVMCCKGWMRKFDNVNVNLAKNQGLPLKQSSINGMCGRLKCCLRFEYFNPVKKDLADALK